MPAPNPYRNPRQPLIYGHRGARGVIAENTMAGFAYLRDIGVRGVELDVQLTRDGIAVIFHDPQVSAALARGADWQWLAQDGPKIIDMDAAQLAQYDVGRLNPAHPYAARFPNQRPIDGAHVPQLDAFLAWAATDADARINIEIKSFAERTDLGAAPEALAQAVADTVLRHKLQAQVLVSSFDWRVLSALSRITPDLARGYLSYAQADPDCTIYDGSPYMDGMSLRSSLPELVAEQGGMVWCPYFQDLCTNTLAIAHDLGLAVNVWTVNSAQDMRRMIEMGVDGIITDDPARLQALLGG